MDAGKEGTGPERPWPGRCREADAAAIGDPNAFTLLPIVPFVGGLLGVIAILIIAVTINGSATKQGKHDELAGGTQVLKS